MVSAASSLSITSLSALRNEFTTTPISNLAGSSRWIPFVPILSTDSLLEVMLLLGKYGVHRVCVVDFGASKIRNIITQSAVANMLAEHLADFSGLVNLTLAELEMTTAHESLLSIKSSNTYMDALRILCSNHISAVPIVTEDGTLTGTLSASDLRFLVGDQSQFQLLHTPLSDTFDLKRPLLTCKADDTLASVIITLAGSHVHRLYLVDSNGHALKIISLREVIAQFVREPEDSKLSEYFAD